MKLIEKEYKISDYVIAYFDILGYKAILDDKSLDENTLIYAIKTVIDTTIKIKKSVKSDKYTKPLVYCFSDNILICIKLEDVDDMMIFHKTAFLISIVQAIQYEFFTRYGIQVRGGLVKGKLYTDKNFVHGQGLIDAYNIESQVAIYPRVVISPSLVEEILNGAKETAMEISTPELTFNPNDINENNVFHYYSNMVVDYAFSKNHIESEAYKTWNRDDYELVSIKKDFDNQYFVDYLQMMKFMPEESDDSGEYNNWENVFFCCIFFLGHFMQKYSNNTRVLIKYLWSCSYINWFCNEIGYTQFLTEESIYKIAKIDIRANGLTEYLRVY